MPGTHHPWSPDGAAPGRHSGRRHRREQGNGLAITQALAAEGVSVAAGARTLTDPLAELAAGSQVRPVLVDLTTADGPAQLVDEAVSLFGGLDIVVNNVGAVRPRLGGSLSVNDDDWFWSLTINFLAAVRTTRAALPHLTDRGAGAIVTVSSVNAFLPNPSIIDYCASKAALTNYCDLVLLLASDRASNITGSDFVIDGGLITTL
ncbi:SDR family NAD(P)-dependent oxidoreductase [Streptomyces sp. V1I1]|uniref:SDR family NAD(P)-dependent oxidoreductase n=1 Tax=Streptomyces sp. V1I1 TaxID=3042272 RepID=UPI0027D77848|nr:SDR family NAD(P)-dependent oxidoreductase [Streptomyces sp. V1I1]